MTDRAQFEAMLEALINDDQESAKEIFHNIVVGKSREIYEELLAEDFSVAENADQGNPYKQAHEGANPFAADSEEDDSEEDNAEDEPEDDSAEDDSAEDDIDSAEDDAEEIEADAESDEESDDDIEDRVMDLEDALEDLKAEFEQLMAGEDAEEADHPGIHDIGGDDAMGGMDQGAEHDELAELMEYVLPVSGSSFEKGAVPGKTVGSGNYENAGENNTKSVVAGKNDMGGTTANITNGGVEVHGDAGVKAGGTQGGLAAPTTKPLTGGNINVPGGKAGKTAFKTQVKGGGIDRQAGFDKPGKNAGANTGANITPGETNTTSILKARK